jgi:hypothetical protein
MVLYKGKIMQIRIELLPKPTDNPKDWEDYDLLERTCKALMKDSLMKLEKGETIGIDEYLINLKYCSSIFYEIDSAIDPNDKSYIPRLYFNMVN